MDPVVIDLVMRYDSRQPISEQWKCSIDGKGSYCETWASTYEEAARRTLEAYWRERRERAIKVAAEAEFLEKLFHTEGK